MDIQLLKHSLDIVFIDDKRLSVLDTGSVQHRGVVILLVKSAVKHVSVGSCVSAGLDACL